MTREQANEIVNAIYNTTYQRSGGKLPPASNNVTNWLVESLEALGIMKFEAPLAPNDILALALNELFSNPPVTSAKLADILEDRGYTVVKK